MESYAYSVRDGAKTELRQTEGVELEFGEVHPKCPVAREEVSFIFTFSRCEKLEKLQGWYKIIGGKTYLNLVFSNLYQTKGCKTFQSRYGP